jgi:hypothetical protein
MLYFGFTMNEWHQLGMGFDTLKQLGIEPPFIYDVLKWINTDDDKDRFGNLFGKRVERLKKKKPHIKTIVK